MQIQFNEEEIILLLKRNKATILLTLTLLQTPTLTLT
jgi:hypothetical protein